MTLLASALAGRDCIDDADVLRTRQTASAIGCVVNAPSTLGSFLGSFRWGHVHQLERESRELLARAWAACDGPFRPGFNLDSTICETYGLANEGPATMSNPEATPASGAITRCWPSPPSQAKC